MAENPWRPEEVTLLYELWPQNTTVTVVEIAQRLGRSKNSVVGKAHRLNLDPRPNPAALGSISDRWARRKARRDEAKNGPVVHHATDPLPLPPLNALIEREREARAKPAPVTYRFRPTQCRYPRGERPDWLWCEADAVGGGPYCAEHMRVCYA